MIEGWLSGLADRAGLVGPLQRGLHSLREGFWLVEVNPRPGATLDIFDSPKAPLMELHLSAARGNDWYRLPRFTDSMASMIAYAADPIPDFPALDWPDWTADHQSEGTRIGSRRSRLHGLRAGPERGSDTEDARKQAKQLQSCGKERAGEGRLGISQ